MEYYNKKNEEITRKEWFELLNDPDYKIVGRDYVDGYLISTVWLAIRSLDEKVFETMIFPETGWEEIYSEQYDTEEEAIAGHQKAIEWLKENPPGSMTPRG